MPRRRFGGPHRHITSNSIRSLRDGSVGALCASHIGSCQLNREFCWLGCGLPHRHDSRCGIVARKIIWVRCKKVALIFAPNWQVVCGKAGCSQAQKNRVSVSGLIAGGRTRGCSIDARKKSKANFRVKVGRNDAASTPRTTARSAMHVQSESGQTEISIDFGQYGHSDF